MIITNQSHCFTINFTVLLYDSTQAFGGGGAKEKSAWCTLFVHVLNLVAILQ